MSDRVNRAVLWVSVLWIVAAGGCSEQAGWQIECGAHFSMTAQDAAQFRKSLEAWLDSMGFVPTTSPGGRMGANAGVHMKGEIPTWYQGKYRDSPPFWLVVRTVPRPDTHTEMTEYHFAHLWEVQGTAAQVAYWRQLSADFTRTLEGWLDSMQDRKEPGGT
jgi:hypothetical protein